MAAGAFDDGGVPAPEREIKNPPPNPHTDMYLVKRLGDIDVNQAKTLLLLAAFQKEADKQASKLDQILEKLANNREEFIETNTKLKRVIEDCERLDTKLDRVRLYVFGAAAVLAVISVLAPPLLSKLWPSTAPVGSAAGAEQLKPLKR